MNRDGVARCWNAAVAALVLLAVAVQLVIAARVPGSPPSVTTGLLRGAGPAGRIIRVLSFFTIQSNILSGVVSAYLVVRPDCPGRTWRAVRLAALLGITVTGVVYSAVLADVHEPHGAAETLVNTVVHYVVPLLMVSGWVLFGPRPAIDRRAVAAALLFPLTWTVYTVLRGAIWHWYPYPFVDVTAHGYAVVAGNGVLVLLLLAGLAGLFAVADSRLPARPQRRNVSTATATKTNAR